MRPTIFLLVLAVGVLIAVGALLVLDSSPRDLGCSGFSLSNWRDGADDGDSTDRSDEARALARCDALIGKTQDQVAQILGKPYSRQATHRGEIQVGWVGAVDYLGDTSQLIVAFKNGARATRVDYSD